MLGMFKQCQNMFLLLNCYKSDRPLIHKSGKNSYMYLSLTCIFFSTQCPEIKLELLEVSLLLYFKIYPEFEICRALKRTIVMNLHVKNSGTK